MDEFKPEDELKPVPGDRRPGRLRESDEFDNEPQINVDDVDLDPDDRRPFHSRRVRDDEYESVDDMKMEVEGHRPPHGHKKAARQKVPVSRHHLMMGIGILVLLLLILGIGSALKAPAPGSETAGQKPGAERNIDLSGTNGTGQADGSRPGNIPASGQQKPQDISLPAISSTPTQAQNQPSPQGQKRVEVQGNLNDALTRRQGRMDPTVSSSVLPVEPATVAPVGGSINESAQLPRARESVHNVAPVAGRKKMVIEPERKYQPKPQVSVKTETKPVTTAKRSEPVTASVVSAPPKATASGSSAAPKAAPAPISSASTAVPPASTSGAAITGDVSAIKGASGSHYTLQLSSSSNSANLNAWAKKANLQHYVVYQTVRNGQPWYVLVSGVYASRDDAKRAVSTLPADVQAKNPWVKPIHQVQSDLK